jgi:hypothetical protein
MERSEYKSVSEHTELINGEMRTQVKEVRINNGKGTVTVKYIRGSDGSVLATHTEPLTDDQVAAILDKRIVQDLFKPCIVNCGAAADEQTPRNAASNAAMRASEEMVAANNRANNLLGGGRRRRTRQRRTVRRRSNN